MVGLDPANQSSLLRPSLRSNVYVPVCGPTMASDQGSDHYRSRISALRDWAPGVFLVWQNHPGEDFNRVQTPLQSAMMPLIMPSLELVVRPIAFITLIPGVIVLWPPTAALSRALSICYAEFELPRPTSFQDFPPVCGVSTMDSCEYWTIPKLRSRRSRLLLLLLPVPWLSSGTFRQKILDHLDSVALRGCEWELMHLKENAALERA
ncbi:hypothetical protein EDC01DRAFT_663208 [Geopyxis carbonaria]|nr:hypothetical protein EDC01DRAFT_663208 [Geopyxis carbonaria]